MIHAFQTSTTKPVPIEIILPKVVVGAKGDSFKYEDLTPEQIEEFKSKVDTRYVYDQITASARWVINHNLNKYPSVTIVDSAGSLVVGDVDYISLNQVVISFSSIFSGKAYLN